MLQNFDLNTVDSIIFDWGGVITNIAPEKTLEAFTALGHPNFKKYFHDGLGNDLFYRLEKGIVSANEVFAQLNAELGITYSEEKLTDALCSMLLDTPPIRLKVLKELRKNFRLYLLSNTNVIHTTMYNKYLQDKEDINYQALFNKVYYSYEMGMRKPDSEIFQAVIDKENLKAENTLFLDDLEINLESARSLGIKAVQVTPELPIEKLFSDWLK